MTRRFAALACAALGAVLLAAGCDPAGSGGPVIILGDSGGPGDLGGGDADGAGPGPDTLPAGGDADDALPSEDAAPDAGPDPDATPGPDATAGDTGPEQDAPLPDTSPGDTAAPPDTAIPPDTGGDADTSPPCDDCGPVLQIDPPALTFASLAAGATGELSLTLTNVGDAPLAVSGFALDAAPGFAFVLDGQEWKASAATAGGLLIPVVTLAPGSSKTASVRYTAADPSAQAVGTLTLYANDGTPGGLKVPLGYAPGPCLDVAPEALDFGAVVVGQPATASVKITNCGAQETQVTGLWLEAGSSASFQVGLAGLPSPPPFALPAGASASLPVTFAPSAGASAGAPETGTLTLSWGGAGQAASVALSGWGTTLSCPLAKIEVAEGPLVPPQTQLSLSSAASVAQGGVSKVQWSVQQPVGGASLLLPATSAPSPTFEANLAGTYEFTLDVWDASGVKSCLPATYKVVALASDTVHIELLWDTPGDSNQTDEGPEAGSDLDLHFVHPFAGGEDIDEDGSPDGWFDQPFDVFWFNPSPNWGSFDPAVDDDPSLDRDDTDGAGPENLNLALPQDGTTYRIGVHYWNDHGYGASTATVRVYVLGTLVYEVSQELAKLDMWEVATLTWPSGQVKAVTGPNGGPKVTPDYQNPFFFQP